MVPREFVAFSTLPNVGAIPVPHAKTAITSPGYGEFSVRFVNIAGDLKKVGTINLATPDESQKLPFYYMIEQ